MSTSRITLYLEVTESLLLFVHIYICVEVWVNFFLHSVLSNTNRFKEIYLTYRWDHNSYSLSRSVWTWFNNFSSVPFNKEMAPSWLKHINYIIVDNSRLWSRNSSWAGLVKRITRSSAQSASIIVFVGFRLILASFLVGLLVGWVLWRINLCRLFNAKFCLYVYTLNQRFLIKYLDGNIFYEQDFIFLVWNHLLPVDRLLFIVRNPHRLWIEMVPMHCLASYIKSAWNTRPIYSK